MARSSVNNGEKLMRDRCARTRELVDAYLGGELSGSDREAVDAHLQQCAGCRALCERRRRLDELILSVPLPAPPDDLVGKVLAGAVARRHRYRSSRSRAIAWLVGYHTRFAVSAVFAVIAIFAGALMGYEFGQSRQPQPPDTASVYVLDTLGFAPPGSLAGILLNNANGDIP